MHLLSLWRCLVSPPPLKNPNTVVGDGSSGRKRPSGALVEAAIGASGTKNCARRPPQPSLQINLQVNLIEFHSFRYFLPKWLSIRVLLFVVTKS